MATLVNLEPYILAPMDDPRPPKLWNLPYNGEAGPASQAYARFRYEHAIEKLDALLRHPEVWHSDGTLIKPQGDIWCLSPIGMMLAYSDLNFSTEMLEGRRIAPLGTCWGAPRQTYWVTGLETLWSRYVYMMQHPNLYSPYECDIRLNTVKTWMQRIPRYTHISGDYVLELHLLVL
jgi:hypothetical protein